MRQLKRIMVVKGEEVMNINIATGDDVLFVIEELDGSKTSQYLSFSQILGDLDSPPMPETAQNSKTRQNRQKRPYTTKSKTHGLRRALNLSVRAIEHGVWTTGAPIDRHMVAVRVKERIAEESELFGLLKTEDPEFGHKIETIVRNIT